MLLKFGTEPLESCTFCPVMANVRYPFPDATGILTVGLKQDFFGENVLDILLLKLIPFILALFANASQFPSELKIHLYLLIVKPTKLMHQILSPLVSQQQDEKQIMENDVHVL